MTSEDLHELVSDADSLAEFIERAEANDVREDVQASYLLEEVWERDVPTGRVIGILQREHNRLNSYQRISLSESSRAPRYMDLNDLELVSGHEFEYVLAEILRRVDGEATVTEGSGDQGVDVVWFREAETVGIQAKAYDITNPVGMSAIQEIYTGKDSRADYEIETPAVVTTSRYTAGAIEEADKVGVTLYGRSDLRDWLAEAELDAESMGAVLDNAN